MIDSEFTDKDIALARARYREALRVKCPKGFVPLPGFGNADICKSCRRPYAAHVAIEQ